MFRSLHKLSAQSIVSLDPEWKHRVDELRTWSRIDLLVCPECRQPVRFRLPARRRRHFAHKHRANCPYTNESAELLAARAVLYTWLIGKQWGAVSLEHKPDGADLPRGIDCWLETDAGCFAYWLIDGLMSPARREALRKALRSVDALVHWVFLRNVQRQAPGSRKGILLSTTEREFMKPSQYDLPVDSGKVQGGASLHYLDPAAEALVTFRALHLVHHPQLYAGSRTANQMDDIRISPRTGEFVHPGEHERLSVFRREMQRREAEHAERLKREQEQQEARRSERRQRQQEQRERQQRLLEKLRETRAQGERQATQAQKLSDSVKARLRGRRTPARNADPRASTSEDRTADNRYRALQDLFRRKGVCRTCGEAKRDWTSYDPKSRTGLCRECSRSAARES